jgi:prevent-host-death family protein
MTMVISKGDAMKTMGAGAFKTQCLSLIDEVYDRNEEIVITKRGKPMAKLIPLEDKKPESVLGSMKGMFKIVGDIVSPITEPWEWDEDVFPHGTPERAEFERSQKKSAAGSAPRTPARRRK